MEWSKTFTLAEVTGAMRELTRVFDNSKVFAFYGDMGAGKTTCIRAACEVLGTVDNAASPTFAIANVYKRKPEGNEEEIYHLDLYRLRNIEEVLDIGIEDYLYNGHYCFIEWPQLAEPLLPEETVKVEVTILDEQTRKIVARHAGRKQ